MIELKHHKGFPWTSKAGCHVKGYLFTREGKMLRGEELAVYVADISTPGQLCDFLANVTGIFALVLEKKDNILLAVDQARTLPLFYAVGRVAPGVSDSVSALLAGEGFGGEFNAGAMEEFSVMGYVTGDETLAEGIFQVEAGQVVELSSGSAGKQFYWTYQKDPAEEVRGSRTELLGAMEKVSRSTFNRMVQSLGGRTAVVALSGGYDSRFILAMLSRMSYERIIAYSYGRPGNPEMSRAEQVAGQLNIQFIPIPYSLEMIRDFEKDEAFLEYVDFSANFGSMFFMQEYFAVKYLREHALVPEDAVFIPGHSGDFLAGSQYVKYGLSEKQESMRRIARRLFTDKYSYGKPASKRAALRRIIRTLDEKLVSEGATSLSRYEDWDLKEKLAKFIVNSCNVYAWFGYEYRLPFYDLEIMDFFRKLPYAQKVNKSLYDSFLEEGLFGDLGIHFRDEIQPGLKLQKRACRRRKIKHLLPGFLLPSSLPENDGIFYHEITARLGEDMCSRGAVIQPYRGSHNSLIISWYLAYLKLKFPHMIDG